jgi:hypothetical protein
MQVLRTGFRGRFLDTSKDIKMVDFPCPPNFSRVWTPFLFSYAQFSYWIDLKAFKWLCCSQMHFHHRLKMQRQEKVGEWRGK